jgi:Glyoxalase/Bleomycin resistance protein/Dioxygenase superfamily
MLQHVGIEVAPADVPRAVEFFTLLGFEQVEPPPALADRFTWLDGGGTQIHLMHEERPVVPSRAHLAILTPDFDITLARLREHGFESQPGQEHWGSSRAHLLAPGGHRVELMGAPPAGQI